MINAKEFVKALKNLEGEKSIPQEIIIDALKQAFINAYQRKNGKDAMVRVEIDAKKGDIYMFNQKNIVEKVEDDFLEVELEEAQAINPDFKVGDIFEIPVEISSLERMDAMHVKQILKQKIREAEKQVIHDAFIDKKDDIVQGIIKKVEPKFCIVDLGRTDGYMPIQNQIPSEKYYEGQRLNVYITDVNKSSHGAQVTVSRADAGFLKRLFLIYT